MFSRMSWEWRLLSDTGFEKSEPQMHALAPSGGPGVKPRLITTVFQGTDYQSDSWVRVGMATAMYTVVERAILSPLPYDGLTS